VLAFFPTVTMRRVEGGGGGGGGGGEGRASPETGDDVADAAWVAWYWAALAFALALFALLRRCRRWLPVTGAAGVEGEDEVAVEAGRGEASSSSISNLTVVAFPLLVERVKVADLPAFFTR